MSVSLEARVLQQILSSTKGVKCYRREEEGQGGKGGRTARSKCLACSRRKPIITVTHLPSLVWATPNTSGIRGDCLIRPSGCVTRWLHEHTAAGFEHTDCQRRQGQGSRVGSNLRLGLSEGSCVTPSSAK